MPSVPKVDFITLRDGSLSSARVSSIDDAPDLARFFHELSAESRQHRFFSISEPSLDFVKSLCDSSDPRTRMTLVVARLVGADDEFIGTASYVAQDSDTAEVA